MTYMDHLEDNLHTFTAFKPLTDSDFALLEDIADKISEYPLVDCTGCQYCMPCPNGVNIPANFALLNSASDELLLPDLEGPRDKEFKRNSKELVKRYRQNLIDGSRADACTQCGVCVSKCPQHIRIPEQLERIQNLIDQIS